MKKRYLLKGMYRDVVEIQKLDNNYFLSFVRDEKHSFPLFDAESDRYNQKIQITEEEYMGIQKDGILLS